MVTDVELSESVGEVYRVTREEISVDAVQRVANLHTVKTMNMTCTQVSWLDITHQKCDVSIFEEVFVMSYERILSCIIPPVHAN